MNCSGTGGSPSAANQSSLRISVRGALAGGSAVAILLAALAPADAGFSRPPHAKHDQAKKEPKFLQVPLIAISIADQRLTLYDKGVAIAHAPVSTGMAGHPTPTGLFSVIQKQVFHRSNIYSGAPMPFMQRITWSGVALHAGVLPGYPASHGCIRMPPEFAVRLYHMTQRGARVVVAHGPVTPVPFSDPHLFTLRKPGSDTTTELTAPVPSPLNSVEMVKTAQTQTPAVVSDASDTAARTLAGLAKPNETTQATLVQAPNAATDSAVQAPKAAAADAGNAMLPAPAPGAPASNGATAAHAETTGVGLVKPVPLIPSQPVPTTTTFAPTTAPAAGAPAPGAQANLEAYGPERPLRPGPITVFVSRKAGKVFVRKGFEQILAMPVTIAHPELALGTHMYTAIDAKPDGTSFDWLTVSMSSERAKKAEVHYVKGRHGRMEKVVTPAAPAPSNATEALDRIEFPPEALWRISSLMSPGATLIISDQGLGPETGDDTDFVVLTR